MNAIIVIASIACFFQWNNSFNNASNLSNQVGKEFMSTKSELFNTLSNADRDKEELIFHHIRVMTSESESWEHRFASEDKLQSFPARLVLKQLLPHLKGMPDKIAIWNSGGRDIDKQGPVKWQIYYAVYRSWNYWLEKKTSEALGEILQDLLFIAENRTGRRLILNGIDRHWTPEAALVLSTLINNSNIEFDSRLDAGVCLMTHKGEKYYKKFLQLGKSATGKQKKGWFGILINPRHKNIVGIDSEVVIIGFEILAAERKDIRSAYYTACNIGSYLGQKFQPDEQLGLSEDEIFAKTLSNADAWWKKNKAQYIRKPLMRP